jgi:heterodisulfide reductase subunit A-like polyferredoxin
LRHALELKKRHPDTRILVLYRDMRTYAFHEDLYAEARKQGFTFVRFSLDRPPELNAMNGKVNLRFFEPMIRREVEINPDLVCLSVATICQPESEALAKNFKVPTDADGFFLEAHVKLRPIDCATEGIYLAGSCHGPKTLQEAAAQARGAAGRAALILCAGTVKAAGRVAEIRSEFCAACGACVELCPATAIEFVEDEHTAAGRFARVRQALCLGCGTCVSACRGGASDLKGFTSRAILSALDVLEEGWATSEEPSSGSTPNPPDRGKVSE